MLAGVTDAMDVTVMLTDITAAVAVSAASAPRAAERPETSAEATEI